MHASNPIVVVKIGGSVFTGPAAYHQVSDALARRLHDEPAERLIVVVSAEHGVTDALLATARDFVAEPAPDALDLLWSTGELRTAALLALALQARGVRAKAANVHQAGLVEGAAPGRPRLRALRLRSLLAGHDIAIVPGFLATGPGGRVLSLGRGGSDLTAVLLAIGLGASRCELIKDVPGYFTADPHVDPSAEHLPSIAFDTALEMAAAGCELVQPQALAAARDADLTIVVRQLGAGHMGTSVHRLIDSSTHRGIEGRLIQHNG